MSHPVRRRSCLHPACCNRGFTLVEILIVMGILITVISAVLLLYDRQARMTDVEEETVEVQQNLRIAVDAILRDIREAGFLVPGGTYPVSAISNGGGTGGSDTVTLNVASAVSVYGVIDGDVTTNVVSGSPMTFTVSSSLDAGSFAVNDVVRIIDPTNKTEPLSTTYTVSTVDTVTPGLTVVPSGSGSNISFKKGFVIVRTGDTTSEQYPGTVLYCLGPATGCGSGVSGCPTGQTCLFRIVNGSADESSIVATNITDLQFRYILDGSTTELDSTTNYSQIRAMRVTLTGATASPKTQAVMGGQRTRELTTVVKLRNR